MPILRRSGDGSESHVESSRGGLAVSYHLTVEGLRFLTEVLRLRDGDEVSADDLDFLIDRGWALEQQAMAAPPPPAPEPVAAREPLGVEPLPADSPVDKGSRVSPPSGGPRPPSPPRPAVVRRSRAREVALQILYQQEQNPGLDPEEIERFIRRRLREDALRDFTRSLVDGVHAHKPRIDDLISKVAENWRLDRMAAIDRNILRLGAYEILHGGDVPPKVAINEALELAKRYSTAQSSRFVNGVLDRLQMVAAAEAEAESPGEIATRDNESSSDKVSDSVS